ncbi:MAG: hypothetical protein C0478_17310 [Planctomyces sp.]|nr:hypothetical protein [Planctomyces sp.]
MPQLHLTRDSVAAGDDIQAPHRKRITVVAGTSLSEVLAEVRRLGYLAMISGDKATWVVEASVPLAVVAQQWEAPVILPAGAALSELPSELHFRYLAQEDPSQVVASLCVQDEHNSSPQGGPG